MWSLIIKIIAQVNQAYNVKKELTLLYFEYEIVYFYLGKKLGSKCDTLVAINSVWSPRLPLVLTLHFPATYYPRSLCQSVMWGQDEQILASIAISRVDAVQLLAGHWTVMKWRDRQGQLSSSAKKGIDHVTTNLFDLGKWWEPTDGSLLKANISHNSGY